MCNFWETFVQFISASGRYLKYRLSLFLSDVFPSTIRKTLVLHLRESVFHNGRHENKPKIKLTLWYVVEAVLLLVCLYHVYTGSSISRVMLE